MPEVNVKRFCGSCGTARPGTDPFCSGCGSPFNRPTAPTAEPVPAAAPAQAWAQPSGATPTPPAQFDHPYTAPPFQPQQHQQAQHASPYGAQMPRPGIDLSALTKPVRVGSRVAPVDVWLLLALAAVNVAILGSMLFEATQMLSFMASVDASLVMMPLAVILTCGALAFIYVSVSIGVLQRNPTSRWLAVVLGAVFTVACLLAGAGLQTGGPLVLTILATNAALVAVAALSPGIRGYVRPVASDAPPTPVSAAAALTYWLAFYLVLNGVFLLIRFAMAAGSPYSGVPVWLLLVGLALLAATVVVIISGRLILQGNPTGRIVITIAAPLAALLRFTTFQGSIHVDFGTWIQAGLAIATVVVLWLPTGSAFFARAHQRTAPYASR